MIPVIPATVVLSMSGVRCFSVCVSFAHEGLAAVVAVVTMVAILVARIPEDHHSLHFTTSFPWQKGRECSSNSEMLSLHVASTPTGHLSTQGEKKYKLVFHKGSFKKKVLKYGTPKPSPNLTRTWLTPSPQPEPWASLQTYQVETQHKPSPT